MLRNQNVRLNGLNYQVTDVRAFSSVNTPVKPSKPSEPFKPPGLGDNHDTSTADISSFTRLDILIFSCTDRDVVDQV